jgi:hypothetical protein
MEGIREDSVYRITIGGETIDLSPSCNDHAVRYRDPFGYLDHIVEFQPVRIGIEDGEMVMLQPTRHFVGSLAVEMAVNGTGIGEVYYDAPCKAVYEDYLEQDMAKLEGELDGME